MYPGHFIERFLVLWTMLPFFQSLQPREKHSLVAKQLTRMNKPEPPVT